MFYLLGSQERYLQRTSALSDQSSQSSGQKNSSIEPILALLRWNPLKLKILNKLKHVLFIEFTRT